MSDVPGIREMSTYRPSYVDQTAELAKGLNVSEKGTALIKEVAGLLASERTLRVSNAPVSNNREVGSQNGATGTPALDNPNDVKAKIANLEELLLKLKMENDISQEKDAKTRVETLKNKMETTHREQQEKIKESLKKMDKAAHMSFFKKMFGWLMAGIAAVFAVAACVATGGAAVGPLIAAGLAIASCVLDATGAMEKITEGLADLLEKCGLSKEAAKIVAQVAITVAIMVASFIAGGAGIGKMSDGIAKTLVNVLQPTMKALSGVGIISGGVSAGLNYSAGLAQSRLTESNKFMMLFKKKMEENQEDLQKIIDMIQNNIAAFINLLEGSEESKDEIATNLAAMA